MFLEASNKILLELEVPLERIGTVGRCRSFNISCALEASNQISLDIGHNNWKLPMEASNTSNTKISNFTYV
jgi:hypothetical protein